MNKSQNTFLTTSQFTLTITSAMIGIGIMYLPNAIMKSAKQDSWMSCILGAIYPIYMVLIANYMCKRFPRDNILKLSKVYFGNFIGSIFNFIFISFFLFILTDNLSGFSYIFRVYATPFLKNYQVFLATLIPIAYISYKGIKPLGRLNEVVFYLTFGLFFVPAETLLFGSLLNLKPVLGSGLTNIVKGSIESALAYSGIEIIFLIYPFLQDSKKLLKCGLEGTAIVAFIYTWFVFATIYYLGIETSAKYIWPILALADSIRVPVINSFRFIFISLWTLVNFKCLATRYLAVSYGLNQSLKKISAETFTILLFPLIILISFLYKNTTIRRDFSSNIVLVYVIFNLLYVTVIAFLIYLKKGDNREKV